MSTRHIGETTRFRGDDHRFAFEFDPATFDQVIANDNLRRDFKAWLARKRALGTLAAKVDASGENPYAWRLEWHRNDEVADRSDWRGRTLEEMDYGGPWEWHFLELAEEYKKAAGQGIACHRIDQQTTSADGTITKRIYDRVIVKDGLQLLILSALVEPPAPQTET